MQIPEGFVTTSSNNVFKQSPREWNAMISDRFKHLGCKQSTAEPYMYTMSRNNCSEILIVGLFVDDIFITGTTLA